MKKILISILLVALISFGFTTHNRNNSNKGVVVFAKNKHELQHKKENPRTVFEGEWDWESNDATKNFSLTIKQDGHNNLLGIYCYVSQSGNKIDCPDGNQISFTLPVPSGNTFSTVFASAFSHYRGNVTVAVDGTHLVWQVTTPPPGEFYCPLNAKMIKQ